MSNIHEHVTELNEIIRSQESWLKQHLADLLKKKKDPKRYRHEQIKGHLNHIARFPGKYIKQRKRELNGQ